MQGLKTLWAISSRNMESPFNWEKWNILECLVHLANEKTQFLSSLQGLVPMEKLSKYERGWGTKSGAYTYAQGYKKFSALPNVPENPTIWKQI